MQAIPLCCNSQSKSRSLESWVQAQKDFKTIAKGKSRIPLPFKKYDKNLIGRHKIKSRITHKNKFSYNKRVYSRVKCMNWQFSDELQKKEALKDYLNYFSDGSHQVKMYDSFGTKITPGIHIINATSIYFLETSCAHRSQRWFQLKEDFVYEFAEPTADIILTGCGGVRWRKRWNLSKAGSPFLRKISSSLEAEPSDPFSLVNEHNEIVVKEGDYQTYYSNDIVQKYFIVYNQRTKKLEAYNLRNELLYEVFSYDNGPDYPSEGLFRIIKNGKMGFADILTGEIIIEPIYDFVEPFKNGRAQVGLACNFRKDGEHLVSNCNQKFKINSKGVKLNSNKVKNWHSFHEPHSFKRDSVALLKIWKYAFKPYLLKETSEIPWNVLDTFQCAVCNYESSRGHSFFPRKHMYETLPGEKLAAQMRDEIPRIGYINGENGTVYSIYFVYKQFKQYDLMTTYEFEFTKRHGAFYLTTVAQTP